MPSGNRLFGNGLAGSANNLLIVVAKLAYLVNLSRRNIRKPADMELWRYPGF
jgi:hypothetical protein